jgi:GNAT superfamily N-acetyltransferase
MSATTNFSGSEAERLGDAIEAAACRDLYAAAPPAMRLQSIAIGTATALLAPTLPVTYFNRVIGLGNDAPVTGADIENVMSTYRASRIPSYWIHVTPSARPSDLGGLLEQRGFSLPARRSWAKFLRDVEPPRSPRTALRIRAATAADANAVAGVVCSAFGVPDAIGPWFAALVGRPKWHVLVAEDHGRVVATGSIFVDAGTGWLGVGATLPDQRGQGAHGALLAARIAVAADLGCRVVATETGEPVNNEPNPSLANIQRVGFVRVCSRLNYAAPAAAQAV